jgi:hypothetical protein
VSAPLSTDALTLLGAIERSRGEETPGRRNGRTTTRAQRLPIVPSTHSTGVSRDQIQSRLRPWGVVWERPQLDRAVKELVDLGRLVFGPSGIYAPRPSTPSPFEAGKDLDHVHRR